MKENGCQNCHKDYCDCVKALVRKEVERKQQIGHLNLYNGEKILNGNNITYKKTEQGLKFIINNKKYTYWSKKNKVYCGTKNTNLTLDKFFKELHLNAVINKVDFTTTIILYFGKYKNETVDKIIKKDINYIQWLLGNFTIKNERDEQLIKYIKENIIYNEETLN